MGKNQKGKAARTTNGRNGTAAEKKASEEDLLIDAVIEQRGKGFRWASIAYLATCFWAASKLLGAAGLSISPSSGGGVLVQLLRLLLLAGAALTTAAVLEASRTPRLIAHASYVEFVRTLLQMAGDVILTPVYAVLPGEAPVLGYQPTPENEEILSRCPSLRCFKQTPFLQNTYLGFVALMFGDFVAARGAKDDFRREPLEMEDGGIIALDWYEPKGDAKDKEAKKVLFINSTLTGDGLVAATLEVCKCYHAQGWRVVVMVKQGCGFLSPNLAKNMKDPSLEPPPPWCIKGLDMDKAVDHVAEACPGLPLCGLGLSTGGAQMRHYVNSKGKDSKLLAAVLLDAGATWGEGFRSIDRRVPFIAKALSGACEVTMSQGGQPAQPIPEEISAGCLPGGLFEWATHRLARGHGYEHSIKGGWEYLTWCDPDGGSNCAVPSLEMSTLTDTVLDMETIRAVQKLYEESPHIITVMNLQGTHMVRWEGWWPRCWIAKASAEFLDSVLETRALNNAKKAGSPAKTTKASAQPRRRVGGQTS